MSALKALAFVGLVFACAPAYSNVSGGASCQASVSGVDETFGNPVCIPFSYGGKLEPDPSTIHITSQAFGEHGEHGENNAGGSGGVRLRMAHGDLGLAVGATATAVGATGAMAWANGVVSFQDMISVRGSNTGQRARVSYSFEVHVKTDSMLITEQSSSNASVAYIDPASSFVAQLDLGGGQVGCVALGRFAGPECERDAPLGIYRFTGTVQTTVGSDVPVFALMDSYAQVVASAYSDDPEPGAHARLTFDAMNTLHLYMESLDEGVSLVSESGHNYAFPVTPPVPEPSTWALMVAGAALLLGRGHHLIKRCKG